MTSVLFCDGPKLWHRVASDMLNDDMLKLNESLLSIVFVRDLILSFSLRGPGLETVLNL